MSDPKKQLSISLTEPVVFLRSSDPSGRLSDPNDPPTIVRGVLTLNVVKPIGISSIDVELTGVMTVCYSEGIASRRTDLFEKHKIYTSTVTVFRADQGCPTSVGPCLSAARESTALASLHHSHSARPRDVNISADLGPTPPYTPVAQSPNTFLEMGASFGVSLPHTPEGWGRVRGDNSEGLDDSSLPPSRPHSCCFPSSMSYPNTSSSFPSTAEERPSSPLHRRPSSSRPVRSQSHPPPQDNNHDCSNTPSGRSRLRSSLCNILDAVMEVTSRTPSNTGCISESEEGARGRSRARLVADEQSRGNSQVNESVVGAGTSSHSGANTRPQSGHMEHREHHLLGLGRLLGLERDKDKDKDKDIQQKSKDRGEGCREFKSGTYSYPISFLLPSSLPPSFSLLRGSLSYTIKAVVHRPGTFTSKLSCQVPLLVVAAPTAGAGEGGDPGPLIIQRQWEGKLAYSLELSSRLLLLGSQRHLETVTSDDIPTDSESLVEATVEARTGATHGTATLNLTLLPLDKIRIWRLSVVVEQHISYFDRQKKLLRDEENRQVRLLGVQDACPTEEISPGNEESARKNKHALVQIPLLPTPISPDRSPLLQHISASADPSILAGPGPYALTINVGLPNCGDRGLRFTMKQKGSIVKVEHFLQLIMRVEKIGSEVANDQEEEKKKKCFDITVQTPITILSCRCLPEYQALPAYSPASEDGLNRPACPCQPSSTGPTECDRGHDIGNRVGHIAASVESEDGYERSSRPPDEQRNSREGSRASSPVRRSGHPSPLLGPIHHEPSPASQVGRDTSQPRSHSQPHDSLSQSTRSHARTHSQLTSTPHSSRPPSPLARYERLVSGLESEVGEAPPSYETISPHC